MYLPIFLFPPLPVSGFDGFDFEVYVTDICCSRLIPGVKTKCRICIGHYYKIGIDSESYFPSEWHSYIMFSRFRIFMPGSRSHSVQSIYQFGESDILRVLPCLNFNLFIFTSSVSICFTHVYQTMFFFFFLCQQNEHVTCACNWYSLSLLHYKELLIILFTVNFKQGDFVCAV